MLEFIAIIVVLMIIASLATAIMLPVHLLRTAKKQAIKDKAFNERMYLKRMVKHQSQHPKALKKPGWVCLSDQQAFEAKYPLAPTESDLHTIKAVLNKYR